MLKKILITILVIALVACATESDKGTLAELETVKVELKDANVEGGLDKAISGYQQFLNQTPESQLTPEAIRRLADLKVEKEFGVLTDSSVIDKPDTSAQTADILNKLSQANDDSQPGPLPGASQAVNFIPEISATIATLAGDNKDASAASQTASNSFVLPDGRSSEDLKSMGAMEAIALYKKLLEKYPNYEQNDQVLYQLSRAYEETGQVDEAMVVMNQMVQRYPNSRYMDEVQFRRGEYFFTRKKFIDAEEAYNSVLKFDVGSIYFERALFKKGWTLYKQEMYEESLVEFFKLLDYKVSIGFDFDDIKDDIERKRIGDTFRVVSLGFSNLGGPDYIHEYFEKHGSKKYEDNVYKELAEFYFSKRRYSDAAATYNHFVDANQFHRKSPYFSMRVIEIYLKGGFPRLVIDAKKRYASTYGKKAEYWNYFEQEKMPEVLGYVKKNLIDLANHYHSLYQNKKFQKDKQQNFEEAIHWYHEFLDSFPQDELAPATNYQLADLYLENKSFQKAAIEYEKSAYNYPVNDKSEKAAYAAVYAYREHLKTAPSATVKEVKREIIRISLRLVDTFPKHEKATIVLGAAVDDLYNMRDFTMAIKIGRRLIKEYPKAEKNILRGAWLVVAHSSFEIKAYHDAELGYLEVLALTPTTDNTREKLYDNLAASIYRQGEEARDAKDYKVAVKHFLRIADVAPNTEIRQAAEYDAAAVLIQIVELAQAEQVLLAFRKNFPANKLQHDVTKKIAYVYKEQGKFKLAGQEYERVAAETDDMDLIREAMLTAAESYEKANDSIDALRVYKVFVQRFPKPLEFALETYYKIAMIYKSMDQMSSYKDTLKYIIKEDANAGAERTDRTRYLAAQSSLVIIEPDFDEFAAIKLVKPFEKSLKKKQLAMKKLVAGYTKLTDYGVADVTAASTYYIAEIYFNFKVSLLESERPANLSSVELEEFNLMVEDQAYPFEEKAIQVHEKNVELLGLNIYSPWIDKSIAKLAKLVPARYAKYEEEQAFLTEYSSFYYGSPRFERDETFSDPIKLLQFFRYSSQNSISNLQNSSSKTDKNSPTDDTGKQNAAENSPLKPESAAQNAPVPAASQPKAANVGKDNQAAPQALTPSKQKDASPTAAPKAPGQAEKAPPANADKNASPMTDSAVPAVAPKAPGQAEKAPPANADKNAPPKTESKAPAVAPTTPGQDDKVKAAVSAEKPAQPAAATVEPAAENVAPTKKSEANHTTDNPKGADIKEDDKGQGIVEKPASDVTNAVTPPATQQAEKPSANSATPADKGAQQKQPESDASGQTEPTVREKEQAPAEKPVQETAPEKGADTKE